MQRTDRRSLNHRLLATLLSGLFLVPASWISPGSWTWADDAANQKAEPDNPRKPAPLAKFITVSSPIDDVQFGRVQNTALTLQNQAVQRNQRALLILEITPGSSQFHQVQGLAKLLTSAELSKVTTVAWIPAVTVTGNNVVLALACDEIVMHPDAELGDIGRGKALDKDEQQAIVSLVEKRHNPKLSPALVLGMMDPQKATWRVTLERPGPNDEATAVTRVVTTEELEQLQESKAAIPEVQLIKEVGQDGLYSGREARGWDVLVVQTVESRSDLSELYNLPLEALREDPTAGDTPRVHLIKVDGMVEPVLEAFLERQIDRALADSANMIIFQIDSYGGFLNESQNLAEAIAYLDPKRVRTVAYVPEKAISGAAIIALGCDEIYMHPGAKLGDAGPIGIGKGQQFERAPEKLLSMLRVSMKTLAEKKNRPPGLAQAMADKDLEVFQVTHRDNGRLWYLTDEEIHKSNGEWVKGRIVPESAKDNLLTVDGKRAHELKLAEPPVSDMDELKQRLGIPPEVKLIAAGRTWADALIFWLNTNGAMFLLVVVGVACIYLELHVMSGLLGIAAAVCFSLLFWSRFLGGTAGWLEVILFLLGLACVTLEIFVIPGFGVFGVSGGLLLFASLILASQTWDPFRPSDSFDDLSRTVGTLGASIVSVIVAAVIMSRYLPHMPILNRMILTPPGMADPAHASEPQLRPEYAGGADRSRYEPDPTLVGARGVALSVLRPAGKAKVSGQLVDVVSEGPYITQGSAVEVVSVSGNVVVVRQV